MTKLLIDASVAICWCEEISDLSIMEDLVDLGYDIVLTKQVKEEITSNGTNNLYERLIETSVIREVDESKLESQKIRYPRLGSGEISVLILGRSLDEEGDDFLCVLDDGNARDACNINHTGTLGLLKILVNEDRRTLDEADSLVIEMKKNGTRLPENHRELLSE